MSGKHDKRIETLMEQITAARREPADVPLHRRGFGVMDDPP